LDIKLQSATCGTHRIYTFPFAVFSAMLVLFILKINITFQ
jgi:hypothetical protein